MSYARPNDFAPWKQDYQAAFVFAVFGAVILGISFVFHYTGAGVLLVVFGVIPNIGASLSRGLARQRGLRVEQAAVHSLRRALPWAKLSTDRWAKGAGNIDAFLVIGKTKFAVEVKSWGGLITQNGQLLKANGGIPFGNPIRQVSIQAAQTGAIPVLWLPCARFNRCEIYKNVMIVNGSSEWLADRLQVAANHVYE